MAVGVVSITGCMGGDEEASLSYSEEAAQGEAQEEARATSSSPSESMAPGAPPADDEAASRERAPGDDGEAEPEPSNPGRQLIYTGTVVLAAFHIEERQREAILLVEDKGGYVTHRSSDHLVLRVPVEEFRNALDELAELGDVLEMTWEAEDVTDQIRDLEIRLENSIELQNRLQNLLERADTVEEALEIESELERVTLQIERLRGQLETMGERVAYSTIELQFDPKEVDEVPDEEFLLPVAWLDDLGLESLLSAPEIYR